MSGLSLGLGLGLSRSQGGFSLASFMAGQTDGFWYDFGSPDRLFQTTDESSPVTTVGQSIGRVNDRRTGPNSPRNADQATAGSRPSYQTTGASFDGTADNLLTGYTAGAGANFIVAKVTVPASISANPVFLGAATAANRCHMGVDSTTGQLRIGLGSQLATVGTTDRRGQTVVFGISWNGTTARFYDGGTLIENAQSGTPTTTTPLRIGSMNNSGTASSFWPGHIGDAVAGREFLTLDRFNQIAAGL